MIMFKGLLSFSLINTQLSKNIRLHLMYNKGVVAFSIHPDSKSTVICTISKCKSTRSLHILHMHFSDVVALYLCPCGTVFNTDSSFLKIIFGQRSVMMTSQTSFSSVLALFGWVKKYCLICIKNTLHFKIRKWGFAKRP